MLLRALALVLAAIGLLPACSEGTRNAGQRATTTASPSPSTTSFDPLAPGATTVIPDVPVDPSMSRRMADSPLRGRYAAGGVWTGQQVLIWGGATSFRAPEGDAVASDGGAYSPVADRWRLLAAAPIPGRSLAVTAWTGTHMLVFGGRDAQYQPFADGAEYDPGTDRWTINPSVPVPEGSGVTAGAWTGQELLVWIDKTSQAASYNPTQRRWRVLSSPLPGPRTQPLVVWTGSTVAFFGGLDGRGIPSFGDGAFYDPRVDRWDAAPHAPVSLVSVAAVDGKIVAAGEGGRIVALDRGATSWTAVTTPVLAGAGDPAGRARLTVDQLVSGGGELFALGWFGDGSNPVRTGGAVYDPDGGGWRVLPRGGRPSGRGVRVWTGEDIVVWGGQGLDGGTMLEEGIILRP